VKIDEFVGYKCIAGVSLYLSKLEITFANPKMFPYQILIKIVFYLHRGVKYKFANFAFFAKSGLLL
jgi:hypothetical protein